MAPALIDKASNQIDKIAQRRIWLIVQQGGKEIERILPKIIKSAVEEVYKTPFCLLRKFGRKKYYQKIKNSNRYSGKQIIKISKEKMENEERPKNSTIAADITIETVPEN